MDAPAEFRNSYLDSLRGIAVLSVVSVHSLQVANSARLRPEQSVLLETGQYGVQLFFFISGWLIYMIYGNSPNFSMMTFAKRRFARIYPLWALFVVFGSLINFAQLGLFFGTITRTERLSDNLSLTLTLLLGLSFTLWTFAPFWNSVVPGGWSIQCEVYNYVLFALLRKLSLSKLVSVIILLNLSFAIILRIDAISAFPVLSGIINAFNRLNLLNSFSYFLLGILIYKIFLLFSSNFGYSSRIKGSITNMALVCSLVLSMALTPITFGNQTHCFLYMTTVILLCGFFQKFGFIVNLLSRLGKYSYSIYFTHFYLLSVIVIFKPTFLFTSSISVYISWALLTLITLIATYIVGKFSWNFFESPLKKLLR
jgi:peptidoglycan/LPS O-acetylase OafA/YrhL